MKGDLNRWQLFDKRFASGKFLPVEEACLIAFFTSICFFHCLVRKIIAVKLYRPMFAFFHRLAHKIPTVKLQRSKLAIVDDVVVRRYGSV